jgi:hypothetical protein
LNRRHYNFAVLIACVCVLGLAFVFRVDSNDVRIFGFDWPFDCALHKTFNVKCSLCGMTRAFSCLAHGDIIKSFEYHRIGFFLFCFILLQIPYRIWALMIYPGKINTKIVKMNIAMTICIAVGILINWTIYLGGRFIE